MRIGVVGAGIVGLATAHELLRRGHEVACFEAVAPMAARSVGDTRIFRLAHQRPELVEWAARARAGWTAWGAAAGSALVGAEGTVISGDIGAWAAAMAAAGAEHAVTDEPPELFKLAPVLAEVLADAAVERSVPADLLAVGHEG